MMPPAFVSEASVREMLTLNATSTQSKLSSGQIGSNIRAASAQLERLTGRYFADRRATLKFTTSGDAIVRIPGLRTAYSVSLSGTPLTADETYWLLPDAFQTGVYTGIQIRALRNARDDGPAYLANPEWFDRNLDHPRWGRNTGLPNDLTIDADWGYVDSGLPEPLLHATKIWAGWYTKRPDSLLANVQIDTAGNVLNYGETPPEVVAFIESWKVTGARAVVVG